VLVATDDERIASVVQKAGVECAMSPTTCRSGTDRIAFVAETFGLSDDQVVVNVQGDEPALPEEHLRHVIAPFSDPAVTMSTVVRPLLPDERNNPHVVKAVLDGKGQALYFSRADIPAEREAGAFPIERWAHVGLYGYRVKTLKWLSALAPVELEQTESLEQLRALFYGVPIVCSKVTSLSVAVDRPEDVPAAEAAILRLQHA
jgi:3-deoxy-manno-octulosonate cytidylyltransferase (CMP-KDO synthetase)